MLLFVLLLVGCAEGQKYETVRLRIDNAALEYLNTGLRDLIPTIQEELKHFPIPSVTGNSFGLTRMYVQQNRLGSTGINFMDNGLRVTSSGNNFYMTGEFWVRKIIAIRGKAAIHMENLALDTTVDFAKVNGKLGFKLKSCKLSMSKLHVNLYNPVLNFILDIMRGAVKSTATRALCDAFRDYGVAALNNALQGVPKSIDIENIGKIVYKPGSTWVTSKGLSTSHFAVAQPMSGNVPWKFREKQLPYPLTTQGQYCIWVSEYMINTIIGTFLPAGRFLETVDAGKNMGLDGPLSVRMTNSDRPDVTLEKDYIYFNSPMKLSLKGGAVDLGDYKANMHLRSSTDITMNTVKRALAAAGYELPQQLKDVNFPDKDMDPMEYLLNHVSPSADYLKLFDVHSETSSGAKMICGMFRATDLLKKLIKDATVKFLRGRRSTSAGYQYDGVSAIPVQ